MNAARLTRGAGTAIETPMDGGKPRRHRGARRTLVLLAGSMALSGCINVNAPSEPIVIELNINIRQEVIYRLAADAGNTIEENADIF
jgi:hypothetical protein